MGGWSVITLMCAVVITFVSIVALVVGIVAAFDGRLSPLPLPPPLPIYTAPTSPPGTSSFEANLLNEALPPADETGEELDMLDPDDDPLVLPAREPTIAEAARLRAQQAAPAGAASAEDEENAPGKKSTWFARLRGSLRKTGWWQLLLASLLFLPAILIFNRVDNIYGGLATFTTGAWLNLGLLLLQLALLVWYRRCQKALPPPPPEG